MSHYGTSSPTLVEAEPQLTPRASLSRKIGRSRSGSLSPADSPGFTPRISTLATMSSKENLLSESFGTAPSPAHSDDSLLDLPEIPDLRWEQNANGDWVRTTSASPLVPPSTLNVRRSLSRQSSHSPSSPHSQLPSPTNEAKTQTQRRSPHLHPAEGASFLSSATNGTSSLSTFKAGQTPNARTLARSASTSFASASTPAASSARLPPSAGLTGTGRKIGRARRVKIEDHNVQAQPVDQRQHTNGATGAAGDKYASLSLSTSTSGYAREKENAPDYDSVATPTVVSSFSSKPLADVVPLPQQQSQGQGQGRSLSAYGRQVLPVPSRSASRLKVRVDTIAETIDGESSLRAAPHLVLVVVVFHARTPSPPSVNIPFGRSVACPF